MIARAYIENEPNWTGNQSEAKPEAHRCFLCVCQNPGQSSYLILISLGCGSAERKRTPCALCFSVLNKCLRRRFPPGSRGMYR